MKSLGMDYSKVHDQHALRSQHPLAEERSCGSCPRKPVANVLNRKKLNDACHDQAVKAGAKLVTKRITGAELDHLSGKGVVIGADGAVSSVAKHFGFGEIKKFVLTYKAEFEAGGPGGGVVDLFFDSNEYGGLFAWTCPNGKTCWRSGSALYSGLGNAKRPSTGFSGAMRLQSWSRAGKPVTEGASIIPLSLREQDCR